MKRRGAGTHLNLSSDNIVEWLEDNLGKPQISRRPDATHYNYCEFEEGFENKKKKTLSINVSEGERLGKWQAFREGVGGSFVSLVAKFKRIPTDEAVRELAEQFHLSPEKILNPKKQEARAEETIRSHVELPTDLHKLSFDDPMSRPYIQYLLSRSVQKAFLEKCFYSYQKKWRGRMINLKDFVIMPYHDRDGNICFWTARSIRSNALLKYYNEPDAHLNVYNIWTDEKRIILTEGILDAEMFRAGKSSRGIAPGGKSMSEEQLDLIAARRFDFVLVGGNNESLKASEGGGPAKAIQNFQRMQSRGIKCGIFNWPLFLKDNKETAKDFNELKRKINFTYDHIADDRYVIRNAEEALVRFTLNDTY